VIERSDELLGGWREIASDSRPFLSLGICSAAWLETALPVLRTAAEAAPIDGDALLHLDVRSDNICLADRGAVLVDWNWVHRGIPTSTWQRGRRRFTRRADLRPSSSCGTPASSPPRSPASSRPERACRRRRPRPVFGRSSERSWRWRSLGPAGNWA